MRFRNHKCIWPRPSFSKWSWRRQNW